MTTWIKPAVGWGSVDTDSCLSPDQWGTKAQAMSAAFPTDKIIRVALVPYEVARAAGLLRRPKP